MNIDIITAMVNPYLKDSQITYQEFGIIFSVLSLKEKYRVLDILDAEGIQVVPGSEDDEIPVDFFELEIDPFADEITEPAMQESFELPHLGEVKMSNRMICKMIQEGNYEMKQQLCIKNRGLVEKYSRIYDRAYGHDLDHEDLVQAGYQGLIKAAEKFDLSLGFEFSTYATWWITQSVSREIMDKGFAIRLPVHLFEQINKINKYEILSIEQGWDRERFYREVSEETGFDEFKIRNCLRLRDHYLHYASLNSTIGEEETTELFEMIESDDISVEDEVMHSTEREMLLSIAESILKPREFQVIQMRYGFCGYQPMTLEEIGSRFNVTRERIRQIQVKALRKMKKRLQRIGYQEVM